MQGQLDQMTAAQRPWLSVREFSMGSIRIYPARSGVSIDVKYKIVNFGHAPATAVYINPALIFAGVERFDKNTVRDLCVPQPSGAKRLFIDYSDVILSEQTLNVGGFLLQAGIFSHNIEKLQQEGKDTIDADFILTACITYKVLGSDILHATGFPLKAQFFNFRASKYDPEPISIEIGRKGDVKITFPKLLPVPYGNFAD